MPGNYRYIRDEDVLEISKDEHTRLSTLEQDYQLVHYSYELTKAIEDCSHLMENAFSYAFRPLEIRPAPPATPVVQAPEPPAGLTEAVKNKKIAKVESTGRKTKNLGKQLEGSNNIVAHSAGAVIITAADLIENIRNASKSVSHIYEDTALYSDVTGNDVFSNLHKGVLSLSERLRRKREQRKGSRIDLLGSHQHRLTRDPALTEEDAALPNYKYLVHADSDKNLYRYDITEASAQKIMERFRELASGTPSTPYHPKPDIKKEELSLEDFVHLLKRHLDRQNIQHGWATQTQIDRMETVGYLRSLKIGMKARSTSGLIFTVLALMSFVSPLVSIIGNILATQYAMLFIYREHEKAAWRNKPEHLGRNPQDKDKARIEREALHFSLSLLPCSVLPGYSMLTNTQYTSEAFQPISHAVNKFARSLLQSSSIDLRLGLTLLSGLLMALVVTVNTAAVYAADHKHKFKGNPQKLAATLFAVFFMSFVAGMICYGASNIPDSDSNKFLSTRLVEEAVYTATAFMLAFGLYRATHYGEKIVRAGNHMSNHVSTKSTQLFRGNFIRGGSSSKSTRPPVEFTFVSTEPAI